MHALQFKAYGGPDVLAVGEAPEPHAGKGQVRIAVRAASINPIDWKIRAGLLSDGAELEEPVIPGVDGAGVVDEVGDGVDTVLIGDEVFGLGSATSAEYAVLDHVGPKPASMSWEDAAALPVAVETAARTLDLLGVDSGSTVLVEGAAGGVGSAAVQLAVARGATVIGTGNVANHDYIRGLGAIPTTYGAGLAERVAVLAPDGVDAALDTPGKGSVPALIEIVGEPSQVVSIADFSAPERGARATSGAEERATYALAAVADLFEQGAFVVNVQQVFPLADGAEAHRLSEGGHVRGKLVLTVDE
ncbi:MAG: NADP-dependent oxidoreductase [Actinomycetota bacterium]|nr:NADP-dependent oxidoreductase [Actinomycetota bacterium]